MLFIFWGAKCTGCLQEMQPYPDEVLKPYGERKDFFLLPVEAQKQSKAVIEDRAERLGFTIPLACENGENID